MRNSFLWLVLVISGFLTPLTKGETGGKEITLQQGNVSIQVGVPEGFENIPENTIHFQSVKDAMVPHGNDLIAVFAQSPYAGGGEPLKRSMSVGYLRALKDQDVTKEMFDNERQTMGKQGSLEAVHDHSERHFSAVMSMPMPEGGTLFTVATAVLVRARIWYFNVLATGGPEDLAWAKAMAKSWTASVVEANPSDAETLKREEGKGGMMRRAGKAAVYGGIIGVVIAGVLTLITKSRAKRRTQK